MTRQLLNTTIWLITWWQDTSGWRKSLTWSLQWVGISMTSDTLTQTLDYSKRWGSMLNSFQGWTTLKKSKEKKTRPWLSFGGLIVPTLAISIRFLHTCGKETIVTPQDLLSGKIWYLRTHLSQINRYKLSTLMKRWCSLSTLFKTILTTGKAKIFWFQWDVTSRIRMPRRNLRKLKTS